MLMSIKKSMTNNTVQEYCIRIVQVRIVIYIVQELHKFPQSFTVPL